MLFITNEYKEKYFLKMRKINLKFLKKDDSLKIGKLYNFKKAGYIPEIC